MSALQPFNPQYGSGQNLTATGTSASVTIPKGTKQVRIVNTGATNPGQIRIGTGAQAATAADLHLAAGASIIVTKAQDHDTLAYISAVGTTFNIMMGEGWA